MKAFCRNMLFGAMLLLPTAWAVIPTLSDFPGTEQDNIALKPRSVATAAQNEWLTYTNNSFGFAFDYPPDLSIVENKGDAANSLLLRIRLLGPGESESLLREYGPGEFTLEVFANPERLDMRTWLDTHGWPFEKGSDAAVSVEIGGVSGLDVSTGRMLAPNRYIYLVSGKVVVRMAPVGPYSACILNSFRLF